MLKNLRKIYSPNFNINKSKAKDIRSSFEFGSIYENLKIGDSKIKVTEISVAPQFKFRPKFAPTLDFCNFHICSLIFDVFLPILLLNFDVHHSAGHLGWGRKALQYCFRLRYVWPKCD